MTGVYGLIWVHGVQVAGNFIPGSLTYLFGSLQVWVYMSSDVLMCVCVCVYVCVHCLHYSLLSLFHFTVASLLSW